MPKTARSLRVPRISDAEWDVMKVVWEHGPLTAGEVVRQLAIAVDGADRGRDWQPRTIKTLLGPAGQKSGR